MAEPAAVPRPGVQRGQRHPGPGAGRVAPTPPPPFPPCFPWGTGAGPPCASPGGRAAWRRRGASVRPGSDGGVAVTPWGGLGLTGRPRRTGRLRHCSGNAEPWPSSEAVYPGSQARGVGGAQECGAGPWAAHSRDTWAAEPAGLAVPSGQGVPAPAPAGPVQAGAWGQAGPRDTGAPLGPWARSGPGQVQSASCSLCDRCLPRCPGLRNRSAVLLPLGWVEAGDETRLPAVGAAGGSRQTLPCSQRWGER